VTSRILVVEDDHGLRDVIARGLRAESYDVVTAADGAGALRVCLADIDAVVLDIGLPDSDGRDVCQVLRTRGLDAPVLFLTARHDITDRLSGFAAGGDDYLVKPFVFAELLARLRVSLRRTVAVAASSGDDLVLDPVSHRVRNGDRATALSPIEFRLLARLLARPDELVRRHQLREAAWPAGAIVSDNTLDQYVSKLRRRLAEVDSSRRIQAARGLGYRLA
jgi:two-component system response regulator MprA